MIRYIEGDIFKSPAQTIVNAVNTEGVMGKGIALEFKKRYVSRVDIVDSRTGERMPGYQFNAWAERIFRLKGLAVN